MTEDVTTSSKLAAAFACLLAWLVLCVPFWLIGIGSAGVFFLPSVRFEETDSLLLSLIFCAIFYGLLFCSAGMGWSALRDVWRERSTKNAKVD
jgi:hypothetical protein